VLREWSSAGSDRPLPSSAFWNDALTGTLSAELCALRVNECWCCQFPAFLTLSFKDDVLRRCIEQQQRLEAQRVFISNRHQFLLPMDNHEFLARTSFALRVRRDHLLEDTVFAVQQAPPGHLARHLMVTFDGEDGLDLGGVSRDFFYTLTSQLFSPNYGMFTIVNEGQYWFCINTTEQPIMYTTLGTIVALAIYNRVILPIRFPLLLYKKLLRKRIGLRDIAELEPVVANSFRTLRETRDSGGEVADLFMTFAVTIDNFGRRLEIELVPGGAQTVVTSANLEDYIEAYVDWYANRSIEVPFVSFESGIKRLFSYVDLALFAADELDVLVSGEEVLDWDLLQQGATYGDGYKAESEAVKWFWEIFWEMPKEDKLKFLQFTTGTDRAPIGGLSKVKIIIQRIANTESLPVSHTCFSIFGLPEYRTKEEMRQKVQMALTETEGFGLR
jgi:ubiquitin-protein ligase E3 A